MTARHLTFAGITALATAVVLAGSLAAFQGGPVADHPAPVLEFYTEHAALVKLSAVGWLLAMLGLVGFAIAFREAMWLSNPEHAWMTILFVQGAGVFATIAVVSAAIGWALADQAAAGAIGPELAATVWALVRALLRFATWGLIPPLAVVGLALWQHSGVGRVCTVLAAAIVVGLVLPGTSGYALYAFAGWLALTGVTLLAPARHPVPAHDLLPR